jgi:hypothetical protein
VEENKQLEADLMDREYMLNEIARSHERLEAR